MKLSPSITEVKTHAFKGIATLAVVDFNGVAAVEACLGTTDSPFDFGVPSQTCALPNQHATCVLRPDTQSCTSSAGYCCAGAATTITISSTLVTVPPSMFYACTLVMRIIFQHAQSLASIGTHAFKSMTQLTQVSSPPLPSLKPPLEMQILIRHSISLSLSLLKSDHLSANVRASCELYYGHCGSSLSWS